MACVASGRNDLMAARRLNEIRISTPFGHTIAAKGSIVLRLCAHEPVGLMIGADDASPMSRVALDAQ